MSFELICDYYFLISYICVVYLSDTALECVLQELLKTIHTDVIFRIIGEY